MVTHNGTVVNAALRVHNIAEDAILAGSILSGGLTAFAEGGIEAVAQYGAKQVVQFAAFAAVNRIGADPASVALALGVDPDLVRIGADSVQLFMLLKAADEESQTRGSNCFAGNTLVQTADGPEAISQVHVGQRVLTQVNDGSDAGGRPRHWVIRTQHKSILPRGDWSISRWPIRRIQTTATRCNCWSP